jgi:N-acetylated-alpha-linked acidic dipeptidase
MQKTANHVPFSKRVWRLCWTLAFAALIGGASTSLDFGPASAAPGQDAVQPAKIPLGFSARSFESEQKIEERFLAIPDAAHCEKYLRRLTSEPHVAGTPGDHRVSQYIFDEFKRDGLNPEMVEYKVLLSYPKKIAVDVVAPDAVKLANPEPEIPGDKSTRVSDPLARMPWNGYSPSADLTAPVVYANRGSAEDYEKLEKLGISVKGKIMLTRYFGGYRGGKSLEAEKRGAAGVIVYSDPADDGAAKGPVYPKGPWGPLGHFQRGAVVYDFITPGDPLTPGWASTDLVRRIPESESKILPKIPMVPLSAADASEILSRLAKTDSPEVPKDWNGGLPLTYRVGDDSVRVHMALQMENRVTPIWDVIGKIPGSDEPEKLVVLSNHHDAWVYGAVDPASGTATMLETARALGELLKKGVRPRRTIILGSWDAEEYTLTGSTEWGEEHADELRKNGVICLNVDSSTSGQDFTVSMSPALLTSVVEATQAVRDPASGQSVYERWKERRTEANIRGYAVESASGKNSGAVPFGILGGGSDFMVFLQHNGVPSLDMIFDGPYGVYHSVYDDFDWMKRYGDPGFRYHAAMSRIWGLLALRFANADLLPLDYSVYAREVAAYLEGLKKIAPPEFFESDIQQLIGKCDAWREAAERSTKELESWRGTDAAPAQSAAIQNSEINSQLMGEERTLLNDEGLPGRPWFRHLIYAPLPSYDAETLPGLRETLKAKDLDAAREQAERLGEALDKARELLDTK